MNSSSIQAAEIGGEREVVSALEHGGPPPSTTGETPLAVLARRLRLSFWGHQAEGNDFIVVNLASIEQRVSR